MRSPVLWPKADRHLENLSVHHVCHHPQETWEAGIRTGIFLPMFFIILEGATAGNALRAPKKSLLYFYASCSTVEEGAAWAEGRYD